MTTMRDEVPDGGMLDVAHQLLTTFEHLPLVTVVRAMNGARRELVEALGWQPSAHAVYDLTYTRLAGLGGAGREDQDLSTHPYFAP